MRRNVHDAVDANARRRKAAVAVHIIRRPGYGIRGELIPLSAGSPNISCWKLMGGVRVAVRISNGTAR